MPCNAIGWPLASGGEGTWKRTNLLLELLVQAFVLVWAELLLEEGQQDGDDNAGLERLSEDDEENRDGEHVFDHGDGMVN